MGAFEQRVEDKLAVIAQKIDAIEAVQKEAFQKVEVRRQILELQPRGWCSM